MEKLVIHNEKIENKEEFIKVCPFSAMEVKNGQVEINAACRMCRLCVRRSKNGEATLETVEEKTELNKDEWQGVCVYVDHVEGDIHPVTFELIGKARELADRIGQKVIALFLGCGVRGAAEELLHYPVDEVVVCDAPELKDFRIEPYTAAFEAFIRQKKPGSILVGATTVGRQLAPRVAARMETGLTADCTVLEMEENTDLSQIRPAFGGNIMANIMTRRTRPQMATVRYKVMNAAPRSHEKGKGIITELKMPENGLRSLIEILSVEKKPAVHGIEHADVIVAVGRGFKNKADLDLARRFADEIGAELACSRPLSEASWLEHNRQIGLSGRTVRPKVIVCCGISGAIQFAVGMKGADLIIAINSDPEAPIFRVADLAIVGDLYEILPLLTQKIQEAKEAKKNV